MGRGGGKDVCSVCAVCVCVSGACDDAVQHGECPFSAARYAGMRRIQAVPRQLARLHAHVVGGGRWW